MRKLMFAVAAAALFGCGGVSKEQHGAAQADAAKYQKALADESGKVAALETKTRALEEQNAALTKQNADLQAHAGEIEKKLAEATTAKTELEVTTARMTGEAEARQTMKLNEQLLFVENSTKLTAEAKRSLDAIADAVAQLKDKHIIVAGYTDAAEAAGKDAKVRRWNLSTARAMEVAKYLVGRGLDPVNIGLAGFGEGRPIAPNDTLANRALNRRVEIALTPANLNLGTMDVKPATLSR